MKSIFSLVLIAGQSFASVASLPNGFVDLANVDHSIVMDIRYFTAHNFVGESINGYGAGKCILTEAAAKGLSLAQQDLLKVGYSLKMYDCYRPQRAVNHFVAWASNLQDIRMKSEFYPSLSKDILIPDYIASKSGHSKGSTFDLTLVRLPVKAQETYNPALPLKDCRLPMNSRFGDNSIDMGTGYDCFDSLAHTENSAIGEVAIKNRHLLVDMLKQKGFSNYDQEWWHYTLKNEPFPSTFFDFPIE